MATTYPLATLAPTISTTGITAPPYSDILASLQASFRLIYGDDAYLEPDSQDGQWVALLAQAQKDTNDAIIAAYNSYSPQTAVGVGLDQAVKINNMTRSTATNSQVNVTLTGTAGTTISSGAVGDADGNRWLLPATVTIPPGGSVVVTATCAVPGSIGAPIGTVTLILTPTAGWQAVTNASAASPGQPVETDGELRLRQVNAPSLSSQTTVAGIAAALAAIPGVSYGTVYENDGDTTDANGVTPHSIACVVQGGDATVIAQTIYDKKGTGVNTYGTTTINITDITGALRPINFFVPAEIGIKVGISLYAGANYTTAVANEIKDAVAAFINAMGIGEDLVVNRLFLPALLNGAADNMTYEISTLQAAKLADALGTADITIAFTEKATCLASNVTITVL